VNILQATHLANWMLKWNQNAVRQREFSAEEVTRIVDHWMRDIDPLESAAAICEGRKI